MKAWDVIRCAGIAVLGLAVALHGQAPAPTKPATAPSTATGDTAVPDITQMLAKAAQAVAQGRLQEAESTLDAARAVNPSQLGLWSMYGDINARKGNTAAAESDYRKELQLHPDFLLIYRSLAILEMSHKQYDKAAATLQQWEAADPGNAQPYAMQLSMLLDQGKYAEAAKAGDDGLAKLPVEVRTDPQFLFYVGTAQCKAGHRDKGVPLLLQALQTNNLALKNSVAYTLADMDVDVAAAYTAQSDVLDRMGLVNEGWTLTEDINGLLANTDAMVAAWDTMGWILFRQHKIAEAEAYVRAAWRNNPNTAVGTHLGEIETARGNHRAALADYEMALAAASRPGVPETAENAENVALLRNKIAEEQKAGTKSGVTDPAAALAAVRTLKLGAAGGRNGSAEYGVLLGRGKVVRALAASQTGPIHAGPELIARANVAEFFPGPGYMQLVHVGKLNCDGTTCEFVVEH